MPQEIDHPVHISRLPLIVREEITPRYENRAGLPDGDGQSQEQQERPEIVLGDPVFFVVAVFRLHPHINNMLTCISGASWQVEQALRVVLDPCTGSHDLSQLARNIVDLMRADRGVTGRIFKPFYRELLITLLGGRVVSRFIARVTWFLEYEVAAQTVATVNPTGVSAPTSSGGTN